MTSLRHVTPRRARAHLLETSSEMYRGETPPSHRCLDGTPVLAVLSCLEGKDMDADRWGRPRGCEPVAAWEAAGWGCLQRISKGHLWGATSVTAGPPSVLVKAWIVPAALPARPKTPSRQGVRLLIRSGVSARGPAPGLRERPPCRVSGAHSSPTSQGAQHGMHLRWETACVPPPRLRGCVQTQLR